MTNQALILTDDKQLGQSLIGILESCEFGANAVAEADATLEKLHAKKTTLVLVDLDLSSGDPIAFLARAQKVAPSTILMPLVSHKSIGLAKAAGELKIEHYLKKPVHVEEIKMALDRANKVERTRDELASLYALMADRQDLAKLFGSSPEIQSVLKVISQAAATIANVMILGEPGTGKRLIGEVLHLGSSRKFGRYNQLSCAGLSQTLIESELFGHEGGLYTGAGARQLGRLELCDGGTLFIDEIGELPRKVQEKLLRFMTDKTFQVLGRRGQLSSADVRIIAASSQNLDQFVCDGRFKKELFDRLSEVQIKVPALEQRKSDIPALVNRFMRKIAREREEPVRTITTEALARLMEYDWPGNVRELESTIAQAVPLVAEGSVSLADLPPFPEATETDQGLPLIPGATIQEIEQEAILRTLEYVGGSTTRAAKTLNMSVRKIQYKLKEYRLTAAATVRSETHQAISAARPIPKKRATFVAAIDPID